MATRYFALVIGVIYLLVGIAGFVPAWVEAPPFNAPDLAVDAGYGYLFGLFPINVVHNIVHLAIGLWGVVAYKSFMAARSFSKSLAVIYALLAIMGLFPVLNTTFGIVPLFSNDIWLHALTAGVAAYFGWARQPSETYGETPLRV